MHPNMYGMTAAEPAEEPKKKKKKRPKKVKAAKPPGKKRSLLLISVGALALISLQTWGIELLKEEGAKHIGDKVHLASSLFIALLTTAMLVGWVRRLKKRAADSAEQSVVESQARFNRMEAASQMYGQQPFPEQGSPHQW